MWKTDEEIILTKNGDVLQSCEKLRNYYIPRTIGLHKYCDTSWEGHHLSHIFLHRTSKLKNVIRCNTCNFRIEIPLEIDDFKKVKKYFENKFKNNSNKIGDKFINYPSLFPD